MPASHATGRALSDKRARKTIQGALAGVDAMLADRGWPGPFEEVVQPYLRDDEMRAAIADMRARETVELAETGWTTLRVPITPPAAAERQVRNVEQVRHVLTTCLAKQLETLPDETLAGKTEALADHVLRMVLSGPPLPRGATVDMGAYALVNLSAGREPGEGGLHWERLLTTGRHRTTVRRLLKRHGSATWWIVERRDRRRKAIAFLVSRGWKPDGAARYVDRHRDELLSRHTHEAVAILSNVRRRTPQSRVSHE